MFLWPKARISKICCILSIFLIIYFTLPYFDQPTAEYYNNPLSRNITTYITHNPAIILPSTICARHNHIVTFVTSAPDHFELRTAIRETWGSIKTVANHPITTYFLLGRSTNSKIEGMVKRESELYDDIVQEDFADSYYNLTIKSLMILKTVNEHCLQNAKYIFKVDDDVFVNWEHLLDDLKPHDGDSYLFMGHEFVDAPVERQTWTKWYVPKTVYKSATYPTYVAGSAYIFTVNLVPKLLEAAVGVPLFHLEDVYISGFLIQRLNSQLTSNMRFHNSRVPILPCKYLNVTTSHYNVANEYNILFKMTHGNKDLATQCRQYKSNWFPGIFY